ncbi:MAG TPA: hypothetical protein DF712_09855 [Balneola sp.]|jgi:hypothetical protein|nr:hypothetical protein [Bacteroidota bacterium]HCI69877.1 hypothetical protein [Balneola sp.]HCT52752.1 hypothetical protein [Balneola sp.]|tara:strand:- start:1569 stop:2318 length:750 start_codon:yes stop_codon:yes gene_type:complete
MNRFLPLFYFLFIFVFISCSSVTGIDDFGNFRSQVSDASLDQETKDLFEKNSAILAYQHQKENEDSFIHISEDLKRFYYDIQVHVATSDAGRERSITANTRIFEHVNLNELLLDPKKDYPFVKNWENDQILTGVKEIDELLKDNDFYIKESYDWDSINMRAFLLRRNEPINTLQISSMLQRTGYFDIAETNGSAGDGSNIIVKRKNDFLTVTYTNAYGDCPSGCISEDYYTFKVHQDGTVVFEGKNINQ